MTTRRLSVLVLAVGLVGIHGSPAEARSLADQLSQYIVTNGRVVQGSAVIADTITPVIVRLGAQATDFPVPPTTPGYVFVYNAEQGIFERSTGSLGPVFLERAETVGANHASIGVSYLYGNVNAFDGDDLAQGPDTRIGGDFSGTQAGFQLDHFALPTHKVNFAATYGVTDDWDVGLLLPVVGTELKVRGSSFLVTSQDSATLLAPPFDEGAFGVGDLLLRTKYRFGFLADFNIAGGLILRFPTGNDEDFHGLGDWTVQPLLIVSRAVGLQDFHLNLGMEFNADDSRRTRARYGVGATLQTAALDWVALLIDIVGTSGLDDEEVSTPLRGGNVIIPDRLIFPGFGGDARFDVSGSSTTLVTTLPRTDQVNVAVGFKFALFGNAIGYVSALVPLTRQGLQADVISAGGIQYSF